MAIEVEAEAVVPGETMVVVAARHEVAQVAPHVDLQAVDLPVGQVVAGAVVDLVALWAPLHQRQEQPIDRSRSPAELRTNCTMWSLLIWT